MTVDIYQDRGGPVSPTFRPPTRGNIDTTSKVMSSGNLAEKKNGLCSSASGKVPLMSRNPNTIASCYQPSSSYNSTEEFYSKDMATMNRPSNLESSNNQNNKRLNSINSSSNSNQFQKHDQNHGRNGCVPKRTVSASEMRDGVERSSLTNASSVSRPGETKRSSSVPTNVANMDGDSVIIEEKRRKINGDGYTLHRYLRGRLLGKGGFAKVYLCTALDTNKAYAIKIVPKKNLVKARARQKLQAEIKIHRTLKHKNVCEYKHFFEDRQNCYILLELCHNQSMNEMIKRRRRLTEPETAYFMRQLVLALKYLHERLVIHRDLKLGNLFLDKNLNIKVGDLGLATKLESADEKRKTICGTPNYIAPEVIQGDRATRGHSFEVDIWSIGVIMFTCLVGKPPYEAKDVKATYQRILKNEYCFPKHLSVSDNAKDMIVSMLQSKPVDRPSLAEISCHPFLTATKIPESLPANATHVAPNWAKKKNLTPALATKKLSIPKSKASSNSQRKPFGAWDENIDHFSGGFYHYENKALSKPAPSSKTNNSPLMDAQVAVKNAWSAVCNGDTLSPNAQSSSKFRVFDETSNGNQTPSNAELVARTASLGLKSEPNGLKSSKLSSNTASQNIDAQILSEMVERVNIVLDIVSSRDYSNVPTDSPSLSPVLKSGPSLWVERYVDYTSKYGLGYLLSDGSSGVYFNDSTKTILDANKDGFQYIERKKKNEDAPRRNGELVVEFHTLINYPNTLQKKVTLLKHFRNYLVDQQRKSDSHCSPTPSASNRIQESNSGRGMVYLKKWVRTKHAIFFRLSDHTVQIVFYDQTEVLLTTDERYITYVDKFKARNTYYMTDELVGCNEEITKRLKYTREILQTLVAGGCSKR